MRKILLKKCLKQVFKPALFIKTPNTPGEGDCNTCLPSEDNKECISYCPVSVEEFEVE